VRGLRRRSVHDTADFYRKPSGPTTVAANPDPQKANFRQRPLLTIDEVVTPQIGNCIRFARYVDAFIVENLSELQDKPRLLICAIPGRIVRVLEIVYCQSKGCAKSLLVGGRVQYFSLFIRHSITSPLSILRVLPAPTCLFHFDHFFVHFFPCTTVLGPKCGSRWMTILVSVIFLNSSSFHRLQEISASIYDQYAPYCQEKE
jgi:hypothetical protein